MTTEATAQTAAPITSALTNDRLSDKCVIRIGSAISGRRDVWTAELHDAEDAEGADPTYAAWGEDSTIGGRNLLIQDFKYEARLLGYKHCEVIGIDGETLSDGALRATRYNTKAMARLAMVSALCEAVAA